ncbi:MAG: DUF4395 domain-containing protein [Gammaproteobacteria bacterium]|nr:DUF4395 domain-containing protein [Gammaproteobacteria bacterium]MBU1725428.1 DUF4395 domain-containing protein [Gammaproteobacteria bacterium]MBU2005298.1 DUF4395 domain-containing protein [Gammaproteobacteria bacterium]
MPINRISSALSTIGTTCKNLWFRDPAEETPYINDTAVRIRAGLLLVIPLFMGLTLYTAIYGSRWEVTGDMITDTLETDWDGHIIYSVEAIRRTLDFSTQTFVLFYALFEMLAGMSVTTSRLSPTILLSCFLARGRPEVWKPLLPKRFAWTIGASLIITCLIFFNPEVFAGWVNKLVGVDEWLPTTSNYMPGWIPLTLVWVCLGFMWMETVLGFCAGCQVHSLLVKLGILKEECAACNNIDWDEIARRKQS